MKWKLLLIGAGNIVLLIVFFLYCSPSSNPALTLLGRLLNWSSSLEKSFVSPNGHYKVNIKQVAGEQALNYSKHEVTWNVMKDGQSYIGNKSFQHDQQFIYHDQPIVWTSENVLRFGEINSRYSGESDEVLIINQSATTVRHLEVNARDKFWLFELKPGSKTRMQSAPQTAGASDLSWISASGEFEGDMPIKYSGVNFRIAGKYVAPSHYCVVITEVGVKIQSKEYEEMKGHNYQGDEVKIVDTPCR